jgi:hypothetical protein
MALSLFLDSLEIPQMAFNVNQTYEPVNARADRRLANGTLVRREAWADKLVTSISFDGFDLAGMSTLDFSQTITLKCIAPRSVTSSSNVIDITADRRSDTGSAPYGKALVGYTWVDTSVSMSVNEATLGVVSGASLYKVFYYPQFDAFFNEPRESSSSGLNSTWSITGQEI